MHVEPMRPVLKAPGSILLKVRYDGPLSKFAFNFNLGRYIEVVNESAAERHVGIAALHEEMCTKLKTAVGRCRLIR